MAKASAQQGEMEFLDHLEELRWRLIKGLIAVVVVAAVCAYFADFIVTEILIGPLKRASPNTKLQNLIPYGQISLYLQAIFFSACGLVFELPFISFVLSKIGLLTPPFMRHYRRHAIVGILILAAIITPSTDIITQLVLAVPMILLYEVSIGISALVQRQREKEEKAQAQPYLQP
jgi:Sec-independent protein secretion pathway component TatC